MYVFVDIFNIVWCVISTNVFWQSLFNQKHFFVAKLIKKFFRYIKFLQYKLRCLTTIISFFFYKKILTDFSDNGSFGKKKKSVTRLKQHSMEEKHWLSVCEPEDGQRFCWFLSFLNVENIILYCFSRVTTTFFLNFFKKQTQKWSF